MKVGTKVEVTLDDGEKWITETRSEPWEVSGTMCVMLKGKSGGYDFSRVKAIDEMKTQSEVSK